MRAVLYCRVSTTEQAQNLSLATQEEACRDYCARHDYDVDEVFVDAGESARTTDRPEFRRLLEHCRRNRGKVHAVLVYSLTRFSRNSIDHHAIMGHLRGLGIVLRSVTEPIDESPSGQLMEGILASFAQFDNEVRAERVRAGMRAAVERGRWCWQAPIGYLNADARKGPSLVADPDKAPAVRAAFELYAGGVRGRALLKQVRQLGLTSKKGGSPISLSHLYNLLRQRAYIARIHPKDWPTESRGDYEPLVSEELFAKVQARLNHQSLEAARVEKQIEHPDFPLRRFVRCATCRRGLTGSWSTGRNKTRYAFYHCGINGCQRLPKATLETAFLALLDTLRPRLEYWKLLEAVVMDVWREKRRTAGAADRQARKRIAELEAKLARVDEAYLYDRTLDPASYKAHRDALREGLTMARMDLSEATVEDIDAEGMLAFAQHVLEHAGALWTAETCTPRRIQVQWTLFPAGLIWGPAGFEPPVTCLQFFDLPPLAVEESRLVVPPATTWKQALTWLKTIHQLKQAA